MGRRRKLATRSVSHYRTSSQADPDAANAVRTGFGLFSLPALRSAVEAATPHDTPRVEPKLAVPTTAPVDVLRFAMADKLVLAGLRDGTVVVWRLKSLVEGQVTLLKGPSLISWEVDPDELAITV